MELAINMLSDITYLAELTLDIFRQLIRGKMSRVKFAQQLMNTIVP
jgi:hypothetical protein